MEEKSIDVQSGSPNVPQSCDRDFYRAPKLPKMLPQFYKSLFIKKYTLFGRHVRRRAENTLASVPLTIVGEFESVAAAGELTIN